MIKKALSLLLAAAILAPSLPAFADGAVDNGKIYPLNNDGTNAVSGFYAPKDKVFEISGAGTIDRGKWNDAINALPDTKNYSILFREATQLPDFSNELFAGTKGDIDLAWVNTNNVTNADEILKNSGITALYHRLNEHQEGPFTLPAYGNNHVILFGEDGTAPKLGYMDIWFKGQFVPPTDKLAQTDKPAQIKKVVEKGGQFRLVPLDKDDLNGPALKANQRYMLTGLAINPNTRPPFEVTLGEAPAHDTLMAMLTMNEAALPHVQQAEAKAPASMDAKEMEILVHYKNGVVEPITVQIKVIDPKGKQDPQQPDQDPNKKPDQDPNKKPTPNEEKRSESRRHRGGASAGSFSSAPKANTVQPKSEAKTRLTLNKNARGYIVGDPDGHFRPEAGISRGEAVAILSRILDEKIESRAYTPTFKDVAEGQWYTNTLLALKDHKLFAGYPDGSFRPNGTVTYAEWAAILSRFLEAKDAPADPALKDHWAGQALAQTIAAGWLPAYDAKAHPLDKPVTRADVVRSVNAMLAIDAAKAKPFTAPAFKDVPQDHPAYDAIMAAAQKPKTA